MTQQEISETEFSLLETCPGTVGELARAINESLPANAPMIALANAFCVAGAMRSGRLQCRGIQANSYHVIVAPSGSGKTEAQKRAETTLIECGFTDYLMGDFTSEAALLLELQAQPQKILVIDEFGRALQEMAQSQGYRGEALTTLFKIYSCSNSLYRGKSYAMSASGSPRPRITIERPQVSVLGSSTPSAFFEGMSAKVALDGLLGRFFLWFARHQDEKSREAPKQFNVPVCVMSESQLFLDWEKVGNLGLTFAAKDIYCDNQKSFDIIWRGVVDRFRTEKIELKASMLARAAELFAKFCIALSGATGRLEFEALKYAKRLLETLYDHAWTQCAELMGNSQRDNEYFVKREKLLSKLSYERALSLTEIGEKTRRGFSKRERKDMLDDLVETGDVDAIKVFKDEADTKGSTSYLRIHKPQ